MTGILAIDTSAHLCSVAFARECEAGVSIEAVRESPTEEGHEAQLRGAVEDLDIYSASIDRVIIGLGPGSFTGLRIGLAFAKGIATARECELIGVGSLEALAHGEILSGEAAAVVTRDARREESFVVVGTREGSGGVALTEAGLVANTVLPEWISRMLGTSCACTPLVVEGREAATSSERSIASGLIRLEVALRKGSATGGAGAPRGRGGAAIAAVQPFYVRAAAAKTIVERRG